jgi:hypothetical protein
VVGTIGCLSAQVSEFMALFEHRVSPNPGIPSNIPIIKPLYHKKYILKQFKTDTLW